MTPRGAALMTSIAKKLGKIDGAAYQICGFIDKAATIYPLGSDTKVLSTVFELITRPTIYSVAGELGLRVMEADKQNYYPDFTVLSKDSDTNKVAIDVKTTYRENPSDRFSYTLGGYTSFIRHETKNILFPFSQYSDHLVIGFVYDRVGKKKAARSHTFTVPQLKEIPTPFSSVEVFVQEKWRIASGHAGSGNTTNIGSIEGVLDDFVAGRGVFTSEKEFLAYWRGYGRTSADRESSYSTIEQFRALKPKL
jgi:hypothetical protein